MIVIGKSRTHVHFVVFLETFKSQGAEQAVQHDHGDEQHVQEQAREYLPRVVHERGAPVRRVVVKVHVHQHGE